MSETFTGFLFITMAAMLWGIFGTIAKFIFINQVVGPLTLLEIRLCLSFFLLFLILLFFRRELLKVSAKDILPLSALGLGGFGALQLFYLLTISRTGVATAVFLQYLAPVIIALWNIISLRKMPPVMKTIAIGLATAGGFLIMRGAHASLTLKAEGVVTGVACAFAFAFYAVYSKRFAHLSPWTLLLYGLGIPLAAWSFFRPPWIALAGHGMYAWLAFIYLAVFATILPFGMFLKGLAFIDPLRAGITSTLEPVIAGASAYFFLGETIHPLQAAGMILVLAGVIAVQL